MQAIELIVADSQTRAFAFKEYALHAAVDGTDQHGQIIDLYFAF
jgi:hypothetical protein